jgi:hypothetical protein
VDQSVEGRINISEIYAGVQAPGALFWSALVPNWTQCQSRCVIWDPRG